MCNSGKINTVSVSVLQRSLFPFIALCLGDAFNEFMVEKLENQGVFFFIFVIQGMGTAGNILLRCFHNFSSFFLGGIFPEFFQ